MNNSHDSTSNKKAIATTTFSWIFMTIVGGILIMFTYSVLQGYWAIEKEANNLEFSKALTNTFHIKAQTLGVQSATVVDKFPLFSQKNIELVCIEGEFSRLIMDGNEVTYEPLNTYLDSFSIFMPQLLEEEPDSIYIIQEDFNFPQAITPLVAIVPTHHIIVLNKSDQMYEVIKKLLSTKKSYKQLSFQTYDGMASPENFLNQLEEYNPSSLQFVNFNSDFIENDLSRFDNENTVEVSHIKVEFTTLPSYLNPSNEKRNVLGNLEYTYSNKEENFKLTDQLSSSPNPKKFKFMGLNDEVSLVIFSLFSNPSNFECSYNSLIKSVGFQYEVSKFKIQEIQKESLSLNQTYCESSKTSPTLNNFYEIIYNNLNNLYQNSTQNFFKQSYPTNIFSEIEMIEASQKELRKESCELVY